MEKLLKVLADFEALIKSGNPDRKDINAYLTQWRKVMPDIQNHADLLIRPEVADTIYRRYTEIGEKTAPEHKELFKVVFADALAYFLLTTDYQHCPHFNQSSYSVNLPFETWDEELNAIRDVRGWPPHYIEPEYFQRCRTCRKNCPHRIIKPDESGPYWRKSEYELRDKPDAPVEEPSQKETRQQKAAKTKKEDATKEISTLLRPLCTKLVAESLAEIAEDGVNFKFLGNNNLYCYLAKGVSKARNLDYIPWQAFLGVLEAKSSEAVLRKTASKQRQDPAGSTKIDSLINETLSEIRPGKR